MTDEPIPVMNRRACDGAYALAILYTIGYLAMVGALMFIEIPASNRELLISLGSIMSAAQLGIIKYFYDGSRSDADSRLANIARASKADAVIQEIAKTPPTTKEPSP